MTKGVESLSTPQGQVKRSDGRKAVRKAEFIENLFGVAA
jgi:hypothetical protein